MAKYNYAFKQAEEEHAAKAVGRALPISTKQSVEICNFIRQMSIEKAKRRLADVINKKSAVPFKRFNDNIGHKKGMIAAGRYPEKACSHVLKLLESVEANAQFKGLNTANLVITHICANKAARPWHYGRQRRRKTKRTNVEIIVEERTEEKKEVKPKKEKATKGEKRPEVKKKPAKEREKIK
jgi:large subunit ribosomal protein L22